MIDAHVHLENGPLDKDYVYAFIKSAQEKGIDHLQILDHTHRFFEFKDMYADICKIPEQKEWFLKKQKNSIQEYIDLIKEVKQENLPIHVSWGLEVCYQKDREEFLKEALQVYPFDFIVGSVHHVFERIYDISAFSQKLLWEQVDSKDIYKEYFQQLQYCIESDLFTQIGHPDVIKMYQIDPGYDLTKTYHTLAELAKKHKVIMEDNTGAYYRYHHPQIGLDPTFRKILLTEEVPIVWASDAHIPDHVGHCYNVLKEVYSH